MSFSFNKQKIYFFKLSVFYNAIDDQSSLKRGKKCTLKGVLDMTDRIGNALFFVNFVRKKCPKIRSAGDFVKKDQKKKMIFNHLTTMSCSFPSTGFS